MNVQNLAAALRGGPIQQDRLLKLDTPLGPNALVVQRAVDHSTSGRDYIFTLDVVSLDSTIELKELIAQPVTLWIQQASGGYRSIHGYVHTARRLGADGSLTTYQITLQAWMHVLKFRRDQRIWTDKTGEDIVSDVLNQHPRLEAGFDSRYLSRCRIARTPGKARPTGTSYTACTRARGCSDNGRDARQAAASRAHRANQR